MPQTLERITIPARHTADKTLILLHGLGADGYDLAPLVAQLNLADSVKVILPHAPVRPITLNQGAMMRGWYDITSLERIHNPRPDIKCSETALLALQQEELNAGICAENILWAGFSQGAAMALHLGTHHPCAGIIALSGYLLNDALPPAKSIPILGIHGTADPIIAYNYAEHSRDVLQNAGYSLTWQSYPIGHGICEEEIAFIANWLKQHLPNWTK